MVVVEPFLVSLDRLDERRVWAVEPVVRLRAAGACTDHDVLRTERGETLRDGRPAVGVSVPSHLRQSPVLLAGLFGRHHPDDTPDARGASLAREGCQGSVEGHGDPFVAGNRKTQRDPSSPTPDRGDGATSPLDTDRSTENGRLIGPAVERPANG